MKKKLTHISGIMTALAAIIFMVPSYTAAGPGTMNSLTKLNLNDLKLVHLETQLGHVDPEESCIIINGIRINVVKDQKMGSGEVITTKIYNEKGQIVPLSELKAYDRVMISAYKSNFGFLFAETIHKAPNKPGDITEFDTEPR